MHAEKVPALCKSETFPISVSLETSSMAYQKSNSSGVPYWVEAPMILRMVAGVGDAFVSALLME